VENSQDEIQAKLKPSILLEVALEEADEKNRDETSWSGTLAIFIESGKSEIEHQIWREEKLAPLLMTWLQLVDAKLNQSPRSQGTVALENEWGEEEQYEHQEISPIRTSRPRMELDIAKWYLRNLESNNFAYPGCENDSMQELGSEVAYLYWESRNKLPPLAAPIDAKAITTGESKATKSKKKNTNKEADRKSYMKLSFNDLEENQDLTREDIVKHKFPGLCKSDTASDQTDMERVKGLAKNLTDQASRAKKEFKKINEDKLELPIRLYTARGGIWEKYALTDAGRPGKGNKYGIIKADLSTDES
jgi:hypothetical protein